MKNVIKTGFKVVRVQRSEKRHRKIRASYNVPVDTSKASVRYYTKRWAKPYPRCGPLAVFAKKTDAIALIEDVTGHDGKGYYKMEIWAIDYVPSLRTTLRFNNETQTDYYTQSQYPGTKYAEKVRLVRKCRVAK